MFLRESIRKALTKAVLNGNNVVGLISGTLISNIPRQIRTLLYVVQSLDWKNLVIKHSSVDQSTEKRLLDVTS